MTDERWRWWYALLPMFDPVIQRKTGEAVLAWMQPIVSGVVRLLKGGKG